MGGFHAAGPDSHPVINRGRSFMFGDVDIIVAILELGFEAFRVLFLVSRVCKNSESRLNIKASYASILLSYSYLQKAVFLYFYNMY